MAAQHVVIAGKGGVGKSTTAANLSAALAEAGKKVLLIGYDTGCSSTAALRGDARLKPLARRGGEPAAPLHAHGYLGVLCVEAGVSALPNGAGDSAGLLEEPAVVAYGADYVIHDLSWEPDQAFLLPAAAGGVVRVLLVTSAGVAAIEAGNRLFSWMNTIPAANCRFGGVVVNNLSAAFYETIVSDFVSRTNTAIAARIPHSLMVSISDFYNQTVLELAPLSHVAYAYRKLARSVIQGEEVRRPKHLPAEELRSWALNWGEIVAELETGIVREGGSI